MRRRSLNADELELSNVVIPENCTRIVVKHNKAKITIRSSSSGQSSIENKQELLQSKLDDFFAIPEHFAKLLPVLQQTTPVSLRLMDWLVTNYSKKNNVYIACERNGVRENINLYLDYKAHLKSYSKRSFDPFCRRERIIKTFAADPEARRFITTTAQLCFFRWAISSNILEYCEENLQYIERDMIQNLRIKTEGIRRAEISPCATASLSRSNTPAVVNFHTA